MPDGAEEADIYVRTASVVFTRSGIVPTASQGIQADATDIIVLASRDECEKFLVIAVSATATLDIEYYEGE